ncbi:hypothetical protein Hanom_Chr11g01003621 [Helianthus anomalus]
MNDLQPFLFDLLCFDFENIAITVINNMCVEESPIELTNDDTFFNETTPYEVYMKMVNHPKYRQIENALPYILDFDWKTSGNTVDCGVPKKATLTRLRKKYTVKLVTSSVNKHRDRILAEAVEYGKACNLG